ncbi:DUF1120 domain-containing protein [Buttiauxella sp. WJP83]|uniref:DUF1120 domain-containing protein n=1 Tax=Buttiauxella sp. WJP83 TaxID=2986951 RepID=UPI0022DD360D|nr:DUF1120 domain-containing protein [Buttiauxella sp. WJP83]WBM68771.1 DUF1120 domain-containing protein [Buttiauxella sp. WJP83]
MKNIFKLCAAAVLVISTANAAFAADTAELKVQGTLIMGSCTPSLPADGVVDFGSLPVNSLSSTAINQLGQKDITLTLSCSSPTKVAWSVVDDRADTVVDTQPEVDTHPAIPSGEFGLGKTADNVKLGSYTIMARDNGDVLIDGVAGKISFSEDDGANWSLINNGGASFHSDGLRIFTFSDAQGTPVAFTTASDKLTVGASVQDTTTLAISDDTALDGQTTISVKYL